LAEEAGISQSQVSECERDLGGVTVATLTKIATAFRLSPAALLSGEAPTPGPALAKAEETERLRGIRLMLEADDKELRTYLRAIDAFHAANAAATADKRKRSSS